MGICELHKSNMYEELSDIYSLVLSQKDTKDIWPHFASQPRHEFLKFSSAVQKTRQVCDLSKNIQDISFKTRHIYLMASIILSPIFTQLLACFSVGVGNPDTQ